MVFSKKVPTVVTKTTYQTNKPPSYIDIRCINPQVALCREMTLSLDVSKLVIYVIQILPDRFPTWILIPELPLTENSVKNFRNVSCLTVEWKYIQIYVYLWNPQAVISAFLVSGRFSARMDKSRLRLKILARGCFSLFCSNDEIQHWTMKKHSHYPTRFTK